MKRFSEIKGTGIVCTFLIFLFLLLFTQVIQEIRANGIKIYDFPECDEDEDEDFKNLTKELKVITKQYFHKAFVKGLTKFFATLSLNPSVWTLVTHLSAGQCDLLNAFE